MGRAWPRPNHFNAECAKDAEDAEDAKSELADPFRPPAFRLTPNCSHSSATLNRPLCARTTNRLISSIGVRFDQGIAQSVTYVPGSYHLGDRAVSAVVCSSTCRHWASVAAHCNRRICCRPVASQARLSDVYYNIKTLPAWL